MGRRNDSRQAPGLHELADRISRHVPSVGDRPWASTALVLGQADAGPAALLIRRTTRDNDRWSGHMALPGGKVDPTDATAEAAAARETAEEVGLRLGAPIGRLDDLVGGPTRTRIATVVFTVDGTPTPIPSPDEVAEAVWLPVDQLASPEARTWHRYGGVVPFRSITVDDYMIWGLTHGILTHFFSVTGLT